MAVPKQKVSRAKRNSRAAHHALSQPAQSTCPQCREPKRPHRVCPHCGNYRDRQVLEINED